VGTVLNRANTPFAAATERDSGIPGEPGTPRNPGIPFPLGPRGVSTRAGGLQNEEMDGSTALRQLQALGHVSDLLTENGIDYWLFGGWAVDLYAGEVTRDHDDIDLAVWHEEVPRIANLLERDGWGHAPHDDEDGGTGFERSSVRIELTFLVRDDNGRICIVMEAGPQPWLEDPLGEEVLELEGAKARALSFSQLMAAKSFTRDWDEADAAKDRADFEVLSRICRPS
jgi:hypothetical protein